MEMDDGLREAFEELKALGVCVREDDGYGDHVAFVFPDRNEDGDEVFADMSGTRHIKEVFEDGRWVNHYGFRQDVHAILRKHRLVTDWADYGTVCVYHDRDAAGCHHGWSIVLEALNKPQASLRVFPNEREDIRDGTMTKAEARKALCWGGDQTPDEWTQEAITDALFEAVHSTARDDSDKLRGQVYDIVLRDQEVS